jgi:hypothetical protein
LDIARGAGNGQRKGDVLAHGEMRIERIGLEDHGYAAFGRAHSGDIDAIDDDGAGTHFLQAGDHAQHRRLAAAGRSEQCTELASADAEIEILDRGEFAVALTDRAYLNVLQMLLRDPGLNVHASASQTIIEPLSRLSQRQ